MRVVQKPEETVISQSHHLSGVMPELGLIWTINVLDLDVELVDVSEIHIIEESVARG